MPSENTNSFHKDVPRDKTIQQIADSLSINWTGWILLERSGKPQDPVKALTEQRQIWERMIERCLMAWNLYQAT